jgi:GDP-4-dehydro-6-deoxy-D-mannose reductase
MRVLVTGAGGFVGRHLTEELRKAGHTPYCFDQEPAPGISRERMFTGDLRDAEGLSDVVCEVRPDACVHLAGIAFVPVGWSDPHLVFSVNLVGTVNLLEAFRAHAQEASILIVTSGEVYGEASGREPLTEESRMAPANPYAASKLGADLTSLLYARRYDMHVMTSRPDNHTGPGQSPLFVTSAFAEQLADIADGRAQPKMHVGNLDNERDFTDVRDVARAYRLLIEGGQKGEAYNIASGRQVSIRSVLDLLCDAAGVRPEIEVDRARYRPTDFKPILDISKIKNDVQWEPEIPLRTTLQDVYADARTRAAAGPDA